MIMSNPKQLAWAWFEALNARRLEDAMAMLDDAGTWWNVGPRTAVPMTTFKQSATAIMRLVPMRFTLHNAVTEGNTVLLEVESIAPKPEGGTYNNRYCYVFELANGKILHVREYPDTKYAAEMLPPEAWAHEQASWLKHHDSYWYTDAPSGGQLTQAAMRGGLVPMSLRLEDIELIKQVTYRYFRSVDMGDFATVESCFSEDASVAFIGGSYRFERQGRAAILEALRSILHERVAAMHTAHHPEITLLSETEAEGIWYLTDWALNLELKIVTHGACLVRNRYRKIDGQWKIQHYGYTRIYEQIDELPALPRITAHALAEACRSAKAQQPS